MDLTHSFTVPAPIEKTWNAFLDIEDVAGCFPGATVTSVEGDAFKGTVKIKLGPISLLYTGSGTFVDRDESAHSFVVEAKGKDKRGNGTAGATVTARMTAASRESTDVRVDTNLSITGKPAQFGRGVIQDVSDKLLAQFVQCLESKVGAGETAHEVAPEAGAAEPEPAAAQTAEDESGAGAGATREPGAGPSAEEQLAARIRAEAGPGAGFGAGLGAQPTQAPAGTDALDLGATVLPVLLKTYWRPLAGLLVAVLVLRMLTRRRRR